MEDRIHYHPDGNAYLFTGKGVDVFNAAALASGLGLWAKGIKPHRDWTLRRALARATHYTGQRYNGRKDIERARADLSAFVHEQKRLLSGQ